MAEEESITEGEETGPPDQFVGRDLLESYIYCINYSPTNPLDRYSNLVKSITFGIELLPFYDNDPSESTPEKIQANKEKQEKIGTLYAESVEVLKTEIPVKRKIEYGFVDHGGERFRIYKIQASENKDAGEFKDGMNNFITQQHEQHISKLQSIHNQILHELTQVGIVPSIDPTGDQIVDEKIKSIFRGLCQPEYEENEEVTK